ncbi:MAG: DUF5985 family protein [Gammaproteobacteria bacterium]
MAAIVYVLGAASTLLCSVLLFRQYRAGRHPLLLWSGLCFAGLTITNVFVFVDLTMLPEIDLHLLRLAVVAVSLCLLAFGLVRESK